MDRKTLKELKETIIDFLYRFKDKHPFCTSFILIFDCIAKAKSFDVADRIMDFMDESKLKPSNALIEEYRQSKTTKTLNLFPSCTELKKIGIKEEEYDKLKKAYISNIIKIK